MLVNILTYKSLIIIKDGCTFTQDRSRNKVTIIIFIKALYVHPYTTTVQERNRAVEEAVWRGTRINLREAAEKNQEPTKGSCGLHGN